MTQYFEKDPNTVADYQIDWSTLLGADTISGTPVWTVPTGLTKDSQSNTTTTSTIWLSAGVAGVTYTVSCRITTAAGRTFDEDLIISVKESSNVRQGMWPLIARVRALSGAGTAEYTVGDLSFWTDDDIQNKLDDNARYFVDLPLTWQPQQLPGTVIHLIAQAPYRDFEQAPGTASTDRFVVRDGTGAAVGTADYTADYRTGRVVFGADRMGTAYYLTGYSYDVYAAAADVWMERITHFSDWYDFQADNQRFNRSQAWDHAVKSEALLRGKSGQNAVSAAAGDLRVGQFVRSDVNVSSH